MHMRVKLPKWPKCACPVMLNMYTSVNINNDLRVNQMMQLAVNINILMT